MKDILMLGCTFALAIFADSALANSSEKVQRIAQATNISHENKSDDTHIRSDSQTELYRLCQLAQTGDGNTIYYSNGKVMTSWAGRKGATWYHPNGKVMTSSGNLISDRELLYPCSYIK
jgi:hypothetical protein